MKKSITRAVFMLTVLFVSLALHATQVSSGLGFSVDLGGKEICVPRNDFDAIVTEVSNSFYDKSFKGLDWPKRVAFYRKQIECSANDESIAVVVNKLLEELKTSHTGLYTPKDIKYWSLKSIFSGGFEKFKIPFSGIWPVKINGEWFVKYVLQGSEAERAGVLSGDKIIALNGKSFEPYGMPAGQESVLRITSDGITERTVKLKPATASMQAHFLQAMKNSKKIIKVNQKNIGYVHLWCGTHERFMNTLNESVLSFKKEKVDGLIVDFRGGFGGAGPDYLKLLHTDPFLKKIPKVFLIDDGVTSGKEFISAIIQRDKIGKLVGSRTAGALIRGGAGDEILGERFFLYVAMQEFKEPNIPKVEGIGVAPDVPVSRCVQFCKGQDSQMEKALSEVVL